jgi:dodecin
MDDQGATVMTVAKIVELSSESTESFEDAIRQGIRRAEKSLKNVKGAWIADQKVLVEAGNIIRYRVCMRVSFVLE